LSAISASFICRLSVSLDEARKTPNERKRTTSGMPKLSDSHPLCRSEMKRKKVNPRDKSETKSIITSRNAPILFFSKKNLHAHLPA
jgi:hypothetical protein